MTKKFNFAVEDIQLINDDVDKSQFSLLSVDAFATGVSAHDTFVTKETLQKTAKTILLKPFVFAVDNRLDDLSTHTIDEIPAGFVPHNSPITFKELPDGRTMLNCQVLIWRRYSGDLVRYFQRDGNRKGVSVEIEVLDSKEDPKTGLLELLDYCYNAITGLGDLVQSAIPNAQAIMAFSQEFEKAKEEYEFSSKYADVDFTIPQNVKSKIKKALDNRKGNESSVSLALARYMLKNENATPERVREIVKFFKNKDLSEADTYGLYGGKTGYKWAMDVCNQLDEIDKKKMQYFEKEGELMPYTKISEINPALKGIEPPISLEQANQIAKAADAIGTDKEKSGWGIAISQFKKGHVVKDGKWVPKEQNMAEDGELSFAKEDWGKGEALKVDKSKESMSESGWGEVDKTALKNRILQASNYKSLVNDVYALVEDGWEDHPSSSLKYPIMQLKGDTLVYNHYGLSAALQRAEGQGESSVVSKVKGIYEKMGLDKPEDKKKEERKNMAKAKEDKAKEEEQETPEEEKAESPAKEKKEKEEGTEKKFSLDAYVDVMAALGFLKNTTDVNEEMASKMRMAADEMERFAADQSEGKQMDYGKVMGGMFAAMCHAYGMNEKMAADMKQMADDKEAYMAENTELKKFKADQEAQQKEFAVTSTLKLLSERVVIPNEKLEELKAKAADYTFAQIDAWKNYCKAETWDFAVKSNDDEKSNIIRYDIPNLFSNVKAQDDIWAEIMKN